MPIENDIESLQNVEIIDKFGYGFKTEEEY